MDAKRRWLAGLASVALVVGAVFAIATLRTDGPKTVVAATSPDSDVPASSTTTSVTAPEDSPAPSTSTTTTKPGTASTTTLPSTTSTTVTAGWAPPTVTKAAEQNDGDMVELPAGSVVFPFQSGRTLWEGTSNGVHIRVQVDQPRPKGGELVNFSVAISSDSPTCCDAILGYDGNFADQYGICPVGPGNSFQARWIYNSPGPVRFKVRSNDCKNGRYAALAGWLDVQPGQSDVQGPELPRFDRADPQIGPGAEDVTLQVGVRDPDGFITGITVDWGDGTATQSYAGDPKPCRAIVPNRWPRGDYVSIPLETGPVGAPTHHYAAAGTYTVTVTAHSAACDGSQPQAGTTSGTWTIQ